MCNMTVKELECCNWINIGKKQTKQILSACDKYGMKGISNEIYLICKDISLSTGIPYEDVVKTVKSKNGLFYYCLKNFQHDFMLYGFADLNEPLAHFVIPDITSTSKVIECLRIFFSLTNDEKNSVFKEVQSHANLIS